MSEPLLRALDLVAGYTQPVNVPISFSIFPGEIVGLWGANGCGKSTLLKAIASAANVFQGNLYRAPGLSLGWQVQQPVRLDEMPFSGHEYLRYAKADREPPPERLAGWLDQRVDSLSGGQFQLLSVWAILGSSADLVLLDEPTNNLDLQGQKMLVDILQSEQGKRAVLLVSHEHEFLQHACSRVLEVKL